MKIVDNMTGLRGLVVQEIDDRGSSDFCGRYLGSSFIFLIPLFRFFPYRGGEIEYLLSARIDFLKSPLL